MLHRLRDLANDFMESAFAGPPIDPQRQGWGRMPRQGLRSFIAEVTPFLGQ